MRTHHSWWAQKIDPSLSIIFEARVLLTCRCEPRHWISTVSSGMKSTSLKLGTNVVLVWPTATLGPSRWGCGSSHSPHHSEAFPLCSVQWSASCQNFFPAPRIFSLGSLSVKRTLYRTLRVVSTSFGVEACRSRVAAGPRFCGRCGSGRCH